MVLLEVLGQFCNTEKTIKLDYLDFPFPNIWLHKKFKQIYFNVKNLKPH